MHKILLSAAMLANVAFAQVLQPNDLIPEGWVQPMDQVKVDKGDYLSTYPENGEITYVADGNAIKITNTVATGAFGSIMFQAYDATGASAAPGEVDITAKKMVYLKMKGTIGDKITVNVKGSDWDAVADYNDAPISNKIACAEYRWYKFDFSAYADADLDDIVGVEVIHNNGVSKAGSYWIDSLLLGSTNVVVELPVNVATLKWSADLTNDWFKSGKGANTIAVSGGVLAATIDATSETYEGIEVAVNDGSKNTYLNIAENPFVRASIKGTAGDTIRVNLKNGKAFTFVDGSAGVKQITANYAEYVFDFSSVDKALLDSISTIEFVVNPSIQSASSFSINSVVLGKHDADGCTLASTNPGTGFTSNKVSSIGLYPNPVSSNVYFTSELTNVNVYDALGTLKMNAAEASSLNVSALETGVYLIHANEGTFKFIVE